MTENSTIDEFLQKLAPCIERGELDECMEEAARLAEEMRIGAGDLLRLSAQKIDEKPDFVYVLALVAEKKLDIKEKCRAYAGAAFAAQLIRKFDKAEYYYKKAIDLSPNEAGLHYLFANVLYIKKQNSKAEEHFKMAIKLEPKNSQAHALYGLFLLFENKSEESLKEITLASKLAGKKEDIQLIHVLRGIINNLSSEINYDRRNYTDSSKFANIAGDEYLNAAKTAEGNLKEKLLLMGNILKAKSFVRKVPEKLWYRLILYKFGKNPNISELIDNLKNAAIYYEKASQCSVGNKQDLCNACFYSVNVFSEILSTIKSKDPEINKNKWLSSLELAHKIYTENNSNNGVALVEILKQLMKCVDRLIEYKKFGLNTQGKRFGKCYKNLIDVSEKLDGAFKIISDYALESIRDYAKKQGMAFIEEIEPKKSFFDNWIVKLGIVLGIFVSIIKIVQFFNLDSKVLTLIKSVIQGIP